MNTYSARVRYTNVLERTFDVRAACEAEAYEVAEEMARGMFWEEPDGTCSEGVEDVGEDFNVMDVSLEEGEEPDEEV